MDRIKFYSKYDMTCGININKIIQRVNDECLEKEWDLDDVIEFYNILKFLEIDHFKTYVQDQTNFDSKSFIRKSNANIGKFLSDNKSEIMEKYSEIDYHKTEDFLELIEKYQTFKAISDTSFQELLDNERIPIYMILKHKRIVNHFDSIITKKLKSQAINAEVIISKFLDNKEIFLPQSLQESDIVQLISDYIDIETDRGNINFLRKIIHFPASKGINITDKIKLRATRKEEELSKKIFSEGIGIRTSVSVEYEKKLDAACTIDDDDLNISIKISRDWIEKNRDYETLWNNFIYLFGVVDKYGRLTYASKTTEFGVLERLSMPSNKHIYRKSHTFNVKEMIGNALIYSYIEVLNVLGIRIEDMIEWFFKEYLDREFSVSNFVVNMPSEGSLYFEKCRAILPEIDRIFKQYNILINEGIIDQELIQISSSSIKIKDIKSFLNKKYVYPIGEWYKRAAFLLFSDQSRIFYRPQKKSCKNFFDLVKNERVKLDEFQDYQVQEMDWLFENNIIYEGDSDYLKFCNQNELFILKELYYEEVINYHHLHPTLKRVIDNFEKRGLVKIKSSLLSNLEQDYLNFYLNKSKFTNGYDIRNKYLHGTNRNDYKQYKSDYYATLKLIIIIILKINDDLCLYDIHSLNN